MKRSIQLLPVLLLSIYALSSCQPQKIIAKASQPMDVYSSLVDSSVSTSNKMLISSGFYEVGVNINLSKNYLDMYHPDGRVERHTFPNSSSPTYKLTFDIRTSLRSDQFNINTFAYFPTNGRPMDEAHQSTKTSECGTYVLRYYMKTAQKKMSGKFVLQYTPK